MDGVTKKAKFGDKGPHCKFQESQAVPHRDLRNLCPGRTWQFAGSVSIKQMSAVRGSPHYCVKCGHQESMSLVAR